MVINIDACIGCYNCVLACKDEHVGNDWLPYSVSQPDTGHFWMNLKEKENVLPQVIKVTYTPIPCMQCKDAPCVKAAKWGAAYTREDGIVVFDPEKAKGQRQIVDACPYGVVYWNEMKDIPEARGLAQKCTFCAHLLDRGYKQPRCAESCPTNAIIFGDLEDSGSDVSRLIRSGATETMLPDLGIDTAVRYISLYKPIIGGSVVFGDTGECGTGVNLAIMDDAGQKTNIATNNYGDFLLKGVSIGKKYTIRISHPKYSPKKIALKIEGDANLGEIVLQKK